MKTPASELPDRATRTNRILLLGLGNDILGDDAVGLNVVREIRRHLFASDSIEVRETVEMGLPLLDYFVRFENVVLVDAIQTGEAPPGFVHEFSGSDLKLLRRGSPHSLGVGEVLALAEQLGLPTPSEVRIFAIEVEGPFAVKEGTSLSIQRKSPKIVARILWAVHRLRENFENARGVSFAE